jgi:hypothetical protein
MKEIGLELKQWTMIDGANNSVTRQIKLALKMG